MQNLVSFYLKESPNCDGRWLEEIWEWDDAEWEFDHDFIQWLFPTIEESRFNPDAPLLNDEVIGEFRKDALLRHNLRCSYERWLQFCGIKREGDKITLVDRSENVWGSLNHNWWRITRVLKSLMILGLEKEAREFSALLERLQNDKVIDVDEETRTYWQGAMDVIRE